MIYITAYPLTQRINPMRKLLLTTAAVAGGLRRPFINYFFIWRFVLANIILTIVFMRGIY